MAATPNVEIAGVRVSPVTFEKTLNNLLAAPAGGRRLSVHFCTAHTIVEAADEPRLRAALDRADLVAPDGMPLVWVGRLQGWPIERVCGPDLMTALLDRSRSFGHRHFFYGGAPGVADRLARRMEARMPGLVIAGVESPPFRALTTVEDDEAIARINASSPDFVWVGLGTPKQDLWIAEHRDRLEASALLAVGAAFDFLGGTRRRAPVVMQRTGTEWLFRLASEPGRLWYRYTVTNARFVYLVGRQSLRLLGRRIRA